jgi:hypothetical protein
MLALAGGVKKLEEAEARDRARRSVLVRQVRRRLEIPKRDAVGRKLAGEVTGRSLAGPT